MIRLALIAWLALCGIANAQLSGGVGGFPGPGNFAASTSSINATLIGTNFNLTNQTTYTFTNEPIGTASSTRVIALLIGGVGAPTVTGVTIGGNAATHATGTNQSVAGGNSFTDIYYLAVPTGTTATIAVTMSGSGLLRIYFGVYSVVGSATTAFSAGGGATLASGTTFASPITLTMPAGSLALGIAANHASASNPISATNLTLDVNNLTGGGNSTLAFGKNGTGSGSVGFNFSWTGATDAAGSVVVFVP